MYYIDLPVFGNFLSILYNNAMYYLYQIYYTRYSIPIGNTIVLPSIITL